MRPLRTAKPLCPLVKLFKLMCLGKVSINMQLQQCLDSCIKRSAAALLKAAIRLGKAVSKT